MLLPATTNLSELFGDDDDDDDEQENHVMPEQGDVSIVMCLMISYFNQSEDTKALQDLFGDDVGLSSSE